MCITTQLDWDIHLHMFRHIEAIGTPLHFRTTPRRERPHAILRNRRNPDRQI
jgi:hypothetical protein